MPDIRGPVDPCYRAERCTGLGSVGFAWPGSEHLRFHVTDFVSFRQACVA